MARELGRHRPPERRRRRVGGAVILALSLVGASILVWDASYAAFNSTAPTGTNSWTAGSVTIANNIGATVINVTAAKPDPSTSTLTLTGSGPYVPNSAQSGGSECVNVTYSGTLTSDIKLYATLTTTSTQLAPYLLFSVDHGTGATDAACTGYTSSNTYEFGSAANSTTFLTTFPTAYATGEWTNATAGATRSYRLSWLLPANVSNSVQGYNVRAVFTWEARNT